MNNKFQDCKQHNATVWREKKTIITNFALQLQGKKDKLFELKKFLYCKRILTTSLQSRAQYLKIFVLKKVLNFVLLVPLVVQFTMDLQTGHLEDRYHARIILSLFTMKFFCIFFQINFSKKVLFFMRLGEENQDAFSERYSLISGVLQSLVKIC